MINDRIASIYEQLQSLLNINVDIIQETSSQNLVVNQPNFDITHGLFKVISNLDPKMKLFFDNINYLLQSYLENTVFDMEWENCLLCGSGNITEHDVYTKDMKDLTGLLPIKVQRYQCKDCDATFALDEGPFNLDE